MLAVGLQGCRAQQPQRWPLWEAYTHRYMDDQGRVIDRSANDRTTSEGQAYAMFFALVDDDKLHFEKLLQWTEANLAQGDLTTHLPAWEWGRSGRGEWKTIDDNSASDADLWMAYTLFEAGRLWHDPRYQDLGRVLATRIAAEEVVLAPGLGSTVAPGKRGFHPETDEYIVNPSYMPLPVLTRLARVMPQGPWSAVLASLPMLLAADGTQGYAMDWVSAGSDGVHAVAPPAEPTAGKREAGAGGSYDAIRTYLWVGMADARTPGERELIGELSGMEKYLRSAVTPPLEVDGHGVVVRADAPVGFSAAVIPYLLARGAKVQAATQRERVNAMRDPASSLYGKPIEYYDQNLVLFSTAWSEQRFRFEPDGRLRVAWK